MRHSDLQKHLFKEKEMTKLSRQEGVSSRQQGENCLVFFCILQTLREGGLNGLGY
jgi:hypothetical protein